MNFESISIDYSRSEIKITSHDSAIYDLLEHSRVLYFGGSAIKPELRAESFKDCIAVEIQHVDLTRTITGKEVCALITFKKPAASGMQVVIWWHGSSDWCIFQPSDDKKILKICESADKARKYCEEQGWSVHTDASQPGEKRYYPGG